MRVHEIFVAVSWLLLLSLKKAVRIKVNKPQLQINTSLCCSYLAKTLQLQTKAIKTVAFEPLLLSLYLMILSIDMDKQIQ